MILSKYNNQLKGCVSNVSYSIITLSYFITLIILIGGFVMFKKLLSYTLALLLCVVPIKVSAAETLVSPTPQTMRATLVSDTMKVQCINLCYTQTNSILSLLQSMKVPCQLRFFLQSIIKLEILLLNIC